MGGWKYVVWKYEKMENRVLKHVMLVWKHKVWECEYVSMGIKIRGMLYIFAASFR